VINALELEQYAIRHVLKERNGTDTTVNLGEMLNHVGKLARDMLCIRRWNYDADALPADEPECRLHLPCDLPDSGPMDDKTSRGGIRSSRFAKPLKGFAGFPAS
jgi:hypothetical protein